MLAFRLLLAVLAVPLAQDPMAKVHPALREVLGTQIAGQAGPALDEQGGPTLYRVYAVLADRLEAADLADELDGLSRKQRCSCVVARLRGHADQTQVDLLALLDELQERGTVERVRQLWIGNAVIFDGSAAAIEAVAGLPEVERIGWDPIHAPQETQDGGPVDDGDDEDDDDEDDEDEAEEEDDDDDRLGKTGELPGTIGDLIQAKSGAPTTSPPLPIPTRVYYEDDFESGVLGSEWATATTGCGVAEVTSQYGPVGNYHVALYTDTQSCLSTASLTLTVDLSTASTPCLRFSFKDMDDEFDPGLDVLEASDDGGASWVPIADLIGPVERVHATQTHRLSFIGLDLVSNFMIRWSWQDSAMPPEDGFGLDDIQIQNQFGPEPPPYPQPNLVQLQATDLWDLGYDGTGVTILNIDRGVDYRHPDLAGRIWVNPLDPIDGMDNDSNGYVDDHMGWDFVDGDNDPMASSQFGQHGTNTAGIMVGDGASGKARTGMAPGAKLAICRINGESNQWAAIQWGLSVGIDCNSSSNSFRWDLVPKPDYHMHRTVHDLVLAAGVIHANSIGNYGGSPNQPIPFQVTIPGASPAPWRHTDQTQTGGGVSAVMAVGGIELDNGPYSISSSGPSAWEDITVYDGTYPHTQNASFWDYPVGGFGGTQQGLIKPDVVAYTLVLTTNRSNGYITFWGTSASTPHVGGAYALLLQAAPAATPAEISQALQETAIDMGPVGKDSTYGAGRIQVKDAALALMALLRADTSQPKIGQGYELTVLGQPGSPFVVAASSETRQPGRNRWRLTGPVRIVATGVLDDAGEARLSIEVPADPGLIGSQLHHQVMTDDSRGKTGEVLYSPLHTVTIRAPKHRPRPARIRPGKRRPR